MSREGEAVQGAVPREEGFASVLRRDAWVKPFFFRYRKAWRCAFLGLLTFGSPRRDVYLRLPGQRFGGG